MTADPDGHETAQYWESEWYEASGDLRPALKNQPQAWGLQTIESFHTHGTPPAG